MKSRLLVLIWALICLGDFTCAVNDEGLALLTFRNGVTKDPLGIFTLWNNADVTPCLWRGIICDGENKVNRILLQGYQLEGTIDVGNLTRLSHLRVFSVSNNSFTGSLPSELSTLSTLWKLNVSNNDLSGSIPSYLGLLGSLRMLDLSGNTFTGAIPVEIFNTCSRLKYISLSRNNLTGTIPVVLGNCMRLEGIDFSSNRIEGFIPEQLSNLSALRYLSMGSNFISGSVPGALANCPVLGTLDLSQNKLSGQLPSSILYHPSLQQINMSANAFSGDISPLPSGSSCANIQVLDLATNNFSGTIPDSFGECIGLQFLNLSSNQLTGLIPAQLGSLSLARSVDLSANKLSGGIPPQLGNLSSLTVLRLGNNPVQGIIPSDISRIEDLIILDLQSMDLHGLIPPELAKCRFLLKLDLSHNTLSGSIPTALHNITYLWSLSLEDNQLSGSIPAVLGDLTNLQYLDLSINQLSGSIPFQLGSIPALLSLNLSYNRLSGPIPRNGVLQKFGVSSFIGNPGLCGPPLSVSCTAPSRSRSHVLRASAIAAIVAAAVIALGVVFITIMNIKVLRRKSEPLVYESTPPSPESSPILGKLVLFSKSLPSKYENWEQGTKALLDKECMIGTGALGTVYKATIDTGVSMAIKRLETLGRIKNAEEFEEEIGRLANVRHPNVVNMQGYFWSSTMQLLLSDFLPNGSLYSHLHQCDAGWAMLDWGRRFQIALGTARGLAYLHHDCRPQILHLNLKSSNILLDNNFEAHLSDYGLSKLLPILNTHATSRSFYFALGYSAPEIASQGVPLTEKCDVYSFGIVLLELATGRQPFEDEDDGGVLCDFVRAALEQNRGAACIDRRLRSASESEIIEVLKLGLVCTSQTPSRRPSMAEVVQVLESIKPGISL